LVDGLGDAIIINSINKGYIKGNVDIGGVVGYNSGKIINCANIGNISGGSSIGGMTGVYYFMTGLIENSYNAGIIEENDNNKGAIIGAIFPVSTKVTLNNVFWYEKSANKAIASGENYKEGEATSITKEQLISNSEEGLLGNLNDYVANYNSQNEEKLVNWKINTESGYPILDI